jgi:eukaryotic-like serine/threonine-protein kinase
MNKQHVSFYGDRIGKYRLLAEIGEGGMAEVYLAVAVGLAGFNKLLVIKKLRSELCVDPELVKMFMDEARLAARINHANIVQTIEVGEDRGQYFIAMEYLDGQPLSRILNVRADRSHFPLAMQLKVLSEVLVGLHHAHELRDYGGEPLKVVHRDATPHNVFVTYDGQVKVMDFGIAKASTSQHQTQAGTLKGKISYMAPEQLEEEELDQRVDIYAVGVMLWEAITASRMWKGLSDIAILHHLSEQKIPSIRKLKANIPETLVRICEKSTAPDRDERYQTAMEFHRDLEDFITDNYSNVQLREIGEKVTEWFEKDRKTLQVIIENQLRNTSHLDIDEQRTLDNIPFVEPSEIQAHSGSLKAFSVNSPHEKSPSNPPLSLREHSTSIPPPHSLPPDPLSPRAESHRRTSQIFLAAAIIFALASSALIVVLISNNKPNLAEAHPPAAVSAHEKSTKTKQIQVFFTVKPTTAKLTLDGKDLPSSPFQGVFVQDALEHRLEIEADGYVSQVELLHFQRDLHLNIALAKASESAPTPLPKAPLVAGHGAGQPNVRPTGAKTTVPIVPKTTPTPQPIIPDGNKVP